VAAFIFGGVGGGGRARARARARERERETFSYYFVLVLRLNLHHMFSYSTYFDIPCNPLLRLVCSDFGVLVAGLVM
jgi:hypothetical protein